MDNNSKSPVIFGNAIDDGKEYHGWFIGHFVHPSTDLRSTQDVEVKWFVHRAGQKRKSWAINSEAITISILIKGLFHVQFADKEYTMSKEGDYVISGPGINHSWYAEKESVVLTVRWPSKLGDSQDMTTPSEKLDKSLR